MRRAAMMAAVALACSTACSTGDEAAPPNDVTTSSVQGAITVVDWPELPLCTPLNRGGVYYVKSDAKLVYCDGWSYKAIATVGPKGADGTSWLVTTSAATTVQCPAGGVVIRTGPDANRDGTLDSVASTTTLCNGMNGKDGADGRDGANGRDGADGQGHNSLIRQTIEPAGTHCPTGGLKIETGLDANGNGSLDQGEVSQTNYVCGQTAAGTTLGGDPSACKIFPTDNPWNTDISAYPVDAAAMATVFPNLNAAASLRLFLNYPLNVGGPGALLPISFDYPDQSDLLPCPSGSGTCYPTPLDAKIEADGDLTVGEGHMIFLDTSNAPDHCVLYEMVQVMKTTTGWHAQIGAIWHLDSNTLRPDGWPSSTASGLPIMPGLVRRDELDRGEIKHAIGLTLHATRPAFIHPATYGTGVDQPGNAPMGTRFRLKASFDDSALSLEGRVLTAAMKKFGVILSDRGTDWGLHAEPGKQIDSTLLSTLHGSDFEIVQTGPVLALP